VSATPESDAGRPSASALGSAIIAECVRRGLTIAVAESLTGGLLVAELIGTPGASAVVRGGIVAYNTELKHTMLGVEASLLSARGPVDPDVAREMAIGVRSRLAVGGESASIGIATTGVAGPDPQDGQPVGTVYIGVASEAGVESIRLALSGSRADIREAVVYESLVQLTKLLESV
jgi:nicotinamide-nucleotide amidase